MKIITTACLIFFAFMMSSFDHLIHDTNINKNNPKSAKGEQMIFTNEEYDNFDAALPHAIKEVKDGEKLWMYVKLRKPIGTYLGSSKFTDKEGNLVENISFVMVCNTKSATSGSFGAAAEQPVFIKGGEKNQNGMVMNKGYVTYLDGLDVEKSTEFKLCLTDYIRHKSSFVFLKCIGGDKGNAGKWNADIMIKGKNLDVFLTGSIVCNVESGIPQYRKSWKTYETIVDKGDISDNVLPPTGKFKDELVRAAIAKEAKTSGVVSDKVVFTKDEWEETTMDDIYHTKQRITYAYIIYKKNNECMYSMVEVTQKLGASGKWGPSLIKLYNTDTPILCNLVK